MHAKSDKSSINIVNNFQLNIPGGCPGGRLGVGVGNEDDWFGNITWGRGVLSVRISYILQKTNSVVRTISLELWCALKRALGCGVQALLAEAW